MQEIWKDIKGYEGYYQASNLGRIRSVDRYVKNKNGYNKRRGLILSQSEDKDGYPCVVLCKNTNRKTCIVHRLIAITFFDKDSSTLEVNHIDFNKKNNNINNLELITREENIIHAKINKRFTGRRKITTH